MLFLGEKLGESKDRLKLLETIRLPLVSVFQRMKRTSESQNLTNNQNQAGLASMETLDDKSNNDLKTVPLDDKKDAEKQEQSNSDRTLLQKLRAYRMAIGKSFYFWLILIKDSLILFSLWSIVSYCRHCDSCLHI